MCVPFLRRFWGFRYDGFVRSLKLALLQRTNWEFKDRVHLKGVVKMNRILRNALIINAVLLYVFILLNFLTLNMMIANLDSVVSGIVGRGDRIVNVFWGQYLPFQISINIGIFPNVTAFAWEEITASAVDLPLIWFIVAIVVNLALIWHSVRARLSEQANDSKMKS